MSSPLVKPLIGHIRAGKAKDVEDVETDGSLSVLGENGFSYNWDIKKPENVELDELDDLFGEF